MPTEAQKRATAQYKKRNLKNIIVSCYPPDHYLYDFAKAQGNVSKYIKGLIHEDMERRGELQYVDAACRA